MNSASRLIILVCLTFMITGQIMHYSDPSGGASVDYVIVNESIVYYLNGVDYCSETAGCGYGGGESYDIKTNETYINLTAQNLIDVVDYCSETAGCGYGGTYDIKENESYINLTVQNLIDAIPTTTTSTLPPYDIKENESYINDTIDNRASALGNDYVLKVGDTMTGDLNTNSNLKINVDNKKVILGVDDDVSLNWDGSNFIVDAQLEGGGDMWLADTDMKLTYDSSESASGFVNFIDVDGSTNRAGFLSYGEGSTYPNQFGIKNFVQTGDIMFYTTPSGGSTTPQIKINSDGDLLPNTDDTRDLGASDKAFQTLYAKTSVRTPILNSTGELVLDANAGGQVVTNDDVVIGDVTEPIGAAALTIVDSLAGDFVVAIQNTASNGVSAIVFFNDSVTSPWAAYVGYDNTDNRLELYTYPSWGSAWFSGGVDVAGALTKGSGSFLIDNPEDPFNSLMFHQFYESPEALLNYRGVGDTEKIVSFDNGHGWFYSATPMKTFEVEIVLPTWFNDLTWDNNPYEFSVQLTGLNGFCGDVYADLTNIEYNKFSVVTEKECKFSWMLQAVRHDPFYEENPMNVIVDKKDIDVSDKLKNSLRYEKEYKSKCLKDPSKKGCEVLN